MWAGVAVAVVVVVVVVAFVLWPLARRDMAEGPSADDLRVRPRGVRGRGLVVGQLLVGVGASLFLVSERCCGLGRFWRASRGHLSSVMVTYHLALLFLVAGVLRPDLVGS